MDSNIYNPPIPFNGSLPGSLKPGNIIKISGFVPSSATCFSINLQNGSRSDIALHLSPVFSSPPRLVRNTLENHSWGPEESHGPPFPLVSGQSFEIIILAESDHFKIAINGRHFTEFHYRFPLHSISNISIDGEVTINSIIFEGISSSSVSHGAGESIAKPLGFVIDSNPNLGPPTLGGRPASPYGAAPLPYPPNPTFGPSPTSPYAPPSSAGMYPGTLPNPQATYNPYDQPHSGRISPSPYGPPSGPYGPYPSTQQPGAYSTPGYPANPQGYPSNQYPSQPGPYAGTSVVYPDQQKKSGSGILGSLGTAGAAALAGAAGSALLGGKHKKKKNKYGHGMGPSTLLSGVSSMVGGNKHGHSSSSGIPIGGALAGGAAALGGAYMMNKVLKPKKMFKHKHKGGWGGWSGSSSSSSDEE